MIRATLLPALILVSSKTVASMNQENIQNPPHASAHTPEYLHDITVTATRSPTPILDTPVAVFANDRSRLERRGIHAASEFLQRTPGVSFSPLGGGISTLSIRGISSLVGAGTVGVYLDDAPVQVRGLGVGGTSTNPYPMIFDIERIEVLKGPQGTLFGAGAEGGAIHFVTTDPDYDRFHAYSRVGISVTENGAPGGEAGITLNSPLRAGETALLLSGYYRSAGGWIDRFDPVREEKIKANTNLAEAGMLRGKLSTHLSDRLRATASVFYQQEEQGDSSSIWRNLSSPSDGHFRNGHVQPQPVRDRFTLYGLRVDYDTGFASLISTTSFFDRRRTGTVDYTTFSADLLGVDYRTGYAIGALASADMLNTQRSFSQEIRLQSDANSNVQWVAGLFYQNTRQTAKEAVHSPKADLLTEGIFGLSVRQLFGAPLLQPGNMVFHSLDHSRDRQIAFYGQADIALTSTLRLIAGLRIEHASSDLQNMQDGPFNGGLSGGEARHTETPVLPRAGLKYKPSRNWTLFATVSKGFRMGGGNASVPSSSCSADLNALGFTRAPDDYKSDFLWSYEAGAKGRLFDGRLFFDGSIFHMSWKDVQMQIPLSTCGFSYIGNAGTARSTGVDVRVATSPFDGFFLEGSFSYVHARYQDTVRGGVTPDLGQAILVKAGTPLPVAPWQASLAADYTFPVSNGRGYIYTEYNFGSAYAFEREGTAGYDPLVTHQNARRHASIRLGFETDKTDIAVSVDNLFNSRNRLSTFHNTIRSDLLRDIVPRPRTVSLTLTHTY